MTAVLIEDLKKQYPASARAPAKDALKGVSLEIPEGSFFGLLGPNGAGKSTMINIMAGLVQKSSGRVVISGHDVDAEPRQSRMAIGVVPQELVVDTFFTVRQALDIHAGYYAVPKARRRTQEIIDALGLSEQADISSRRLSGGMKRRLLIGKALVHAPKVLILDEPTAGVDVSLREQLWEYVTELNRQGTTILLTTHYLEEAETLCDQVAIINKGTLVAMDKTSNLMKKMDSKGLVFRFSEALTEVPGGFAPLNASLLPDGRIQVNFTPSTLEAGAVLAAAQKVADALHLAIADVQSDEPALEDVFRAFTKG